MKKLLSLILLTMLAGLITAGCHHGFADVKGSGKRVVQKRDIGPFTSISTEGAFHLEIVCGKEVSVEVEGDDNILPLVNSDVRNNVLRLTPTKSYSVEDPIVFRISVPNLEAITADGAGKVQIQGVSNDKIQIASNGAAVITVSGTTKMVGVDTNGASKIDTHNLRSEHAVVDSKGASKIDLGVCDKLDVNVSGVSQVTYRGDPVVNKTIHGPGKVEKRADTGA
ncbi:MAG TPA: head GIN domain-containing protein [Pyrinomonadaceae bacterium]|nr:head GIN domain-containing protein [Pyrinomonadaceae bacterium]